MILLSQKRTRGFWWILAGICSIGLANCSPDFWQYRQAEPSRPPAPYTLATLLEPEPEDVPFYRAIADDQEVKLKGCHNGIDCQQAHFLRGLTALFSDQELAAYHFQRVVAAKPNSQLAFESRFWLWLLEALKTPGQATLTVEEASKRVVRAVIERELLIQELTAKVESTSVETLQQELRLRDQKVEKLSQALAEQSQQVEQLKKEAALRQSLQQELKASEKKVEELTNQLEALRRIDQELKEKTPPTRPSEKMAPSSELNGLKKEEK